MTRDVTAATAALLLSALPSSHVSAQEGPNYWVYVANESSDLVSLVRFDGRSLVEEKAIEVGFHPADIDGAHGIAVSPTGQHWYVSIAHGQPFGSVWKMETGSDAYVDSAVVGLFPATMAVTPDGSSLMVANFNLHGDHVPSSISTVFTPAMAQVTQIETCVMPHGSRLSPDGMTHYSACMMSDELVETRMSDLRVARRMIMTAGREHVMDGDMMHAMGGEGGMHGMGGGNAEHGMDHGSSDPGTVCKPTWVVPSADGGRLYVPCNGRGDVLEIDAHNLTILRRFPTGRGPYNADVSPDDTKLVVTLKGDQAVAIFDLQSGSELRVETSQSITHGVVVTPDSRWALVTNEAVGATRGTIDAIDLNAGRVVASLALHYQPGGIGLWKMEPPPTP